MDEPPEKENAAPSGEAHGGGFGKHVNNNGAEGKSQAEELEKRLWQHADAMVLHFCPAAQKDGNSLTATEAKHVVIVDTRAGLVTVDGAASYLRDALALLSRRYGDNFDLVCDHVLRELEVELEEAEVATVAEPASATSISSSAPTEAEPGALPLRATSRSTTEAASGPGGGEAKAGGQRAKLIRRGGYFPTPKADYALLNERCGGATASAKAVYAAMLQIANDRSAATFTVETNVIRSLAGVSLRTTKAMLYMLADLGLIRTEHHHEVGTKENAPNTYTVVWCINCTTYKNPGSCNKRTTGRASDEAENLHGNNKKSAYGALKEARGVAERSARGDAPTPPPSGFLKKPRNFY